MNLAKNMSPGLYDALIEASRSLGPVGRDRDFVTYFDAPDGTAMRCSRCECVVPLGEFELALGRGLTADVFVRLRGLVASHRHPAPTPLTADERERVKVLAAHRRGAWRLAASGRCS